MTRFRPTSILTWLCTLLICAVICSPAVASADSLIVDQGKPNAQIVIAKERPRMVSLAALELQYYIQKITGARLPIVLEPDADKNGQAINIFIGKSAVTEKLGVNNAGLKYGGFRIFSDKQNLVLLGPDYDYTPPTPWGTRSRDADALAQWDELTKDKTDTKWGFPFGGIYKIRWNPGDFYELMAKRYGEDNAPIYNPHELKWSRDDLTHGGSGYWMHDSGGSLNAVYEFLRLQGVRWYMSGDVGTVIPSTQSIPLTKLDTTSQPHFGSRSFYYYNYANFSYDDVMWGRRIGMNSWYEVIGHTPMAHGLAMVHSRTEMQEKHKDYFALINGKRDTEHRGLGHECFSSQGLFQETVNYCTFLYEHYNVPHVSVFPTDGFRLCECELCHGKAANELVWNFVDRVARELYKKFPDRIVSCGAYTPYIWPPDNITRFSPNVMVKLNNAGRSAFMDDANWNAYWHRLQLWNSKITPGQFFRVENNRFSLGAQIRPNVISFPTLHPHAMARDLKALKGVSMGEVNEESQQKAQWVAMGFDHLTLYVGARFLWNADQDVNVLLDEYYEKFYGPAAAPMKAAFTFAEESAVPRIKKLSSRVSAKTRMQFLEMMLGAREKAGDSIYGRRIDFILSQYETMENLKKDLQKEIADGDPRDNAPLVTLQTLTDNGDSAQSHIMKDNISRGEADIQTTFKVWWEGENQLVFKFHCDEPDMDNLYISKDVWGGDSLALLIETPGHSYYHIEVGPDGSIFDVDRFVAKNFTRWDSQAVVKTNRGADFWEVEIRIPVVTPAQGQSDPNHNIAGNKPTRDAPWFFNVGRTRVRDKVSKGYMFSPARMPSFHIPRVFARLAPVD